MSVVTPDVSTDRVPSEAPAGLEYRELSGLAVVSVAAAALALLTLPMIGLFNPVAFAVLPALAMAAAVRSLWQIRQDPETYTGSRVAAIGLGLGLLILAGGWSYQAYDYATEVPDGFTRLSYADLSLEKAAEEEKLEARLAEVKSDLDGQRVFIKGYVYPGTELHGIREFVLCRDNGDCCFGGEPPLWDMIQVKLADDGAALSYNRWQFEVWGTLRVDPQVAVEENLGTVLYHLEEADFTQ